MKKKREGNKNTEKYRKTPKIRKGSLKREESGNNPKGPGEEKKKKGKVKKV